MHTLGQMALLAVVLGGIGYIAVRVQRAPESADHGVKESADLRSPIKTARDAVARGDFSEALANLTYVLNSDPLNADARSLRGEIHLHQNNPSAAQKDLDVALDVHPGSVTNRWLRSLALTAQNMRDAAAKDLDIIIASQPKFMPAFLERGKFFALESRNSEALTAYNGEIGRAHV